MEMNIFAVKDDIVQSFYVSMDENLVRMFRAKIDEWNGKGELKQTKAVNLMNYVESDKKIEVVSKRYSGKGKAVYYCSSSINSINLLHTLYQNYVIPF